MEIRFNTVKAFDKLFKKRTKGPILVSQSEHDWLIGFLQRSGIHQKNGLALVDGKVIYRDMDVRVKA